MQKHGQLFGYKKWERWKSCWIWRYTYTLILVSSEMPLRFHIFLLSWPEAALAFASQVFTSSSMKIDLENVFVAASHQTRLDTRSKAWRPIKVGINERGRSGTSRDSNPASHWPTKCNMSLMSQAVSRT